MASQTLLRLTLPPGTQPQYDWVHPSTEQPQGVGVRALPRHDYMRVNLSKNSKLSLKKKKAPFCFALGICEFFPQPDFQECLGWETLSQF